VDEPLPASLKRIFMYILTLILTAWEFKKSFFVQMKIGPRWLKQNILKNKKCLAKNL
jgi:hypothetical protein